MGLLVLGLSSFVFLSLAGRVLGPAAFAPIGTLWVILNAAGPALFQPLEQELSRSVAHNRSQGRGSRGDFLRGCRIALGVVALCTALFVPLRGLLATTAFNGHGPLVVALLVGLVGLGSEHVSRGAFAGGGNFTRYGWQLGLDGLLRVATAGALAALGVRAVGWYGAALAVAPFVAVLLTARKLGPALEPAPPTHTWGQLGRSVAVLTVGTTLSQFVVNAAPVAANALAGPGEAARAGVFISVLVLARMPLFVFTAVQAALLPGLAALLARGEIAAFRARLRTVLLIVSGLGFAGLAVFLTAGPWIVRIFYGPQFHTTRAVLWPLVAGAALFMVAATLAQTLIALRAYALSVLGWVLGSAGFLAVVSIHIPLEQRVGYAFLASTLLAAASSVVAVRRRLRVTDRRPPVAVASCEPANGQPAR